jgi:hypothetical protein
LEAFSSTKVKLDAGEYKVEDIPDMKQGAGRFEYLNPAD